MATAPEIPDQLDADRHRDQPSVPDVWIRRAILSLFALFIAAGLLGVFGQNAHISTAPGSTASLRVSAPTDLRGGLLFMGLFDIQARETLKQPTLVLGPGWMDDITINTIEPSPLEENSKNRRLELTFPKVEAGEHLRVWMDFQVNPTAVGRANQDVLLRDGTTRIARVDRNVTIFP
jgi:hypothetical protein